MVTNGYHGVDYPTLRDTGCELKRVRNYWYASRLFNRPDDTQVSRINVGSSTVNFSDKSTLLVWCPWTCTRRGWYVVTTYHVEVEDYVECGNTEVAR